MDALESDVNNALEVIRKAERGEKIEYATLRNRRQTTTMQEQMPKHYFVANEIRQHPDKAAKSIVLVIDREAKSADVILPAGASTEANNEIPGMNKGRIEHNFFYYILNYYNCQIKISYTYIQFLLCFCFTFTLNFLP